MKEEKPTLKRCAVYTRKSVEDGLEQEFNSLDAQRESGENYIASQKANGWILIPEHYDDGGFSGGNTHRPALQRLLDDIKAGKIDIIVVYKIDRLSRSLLDFTELQGFFDEHHVSFVSVTQEINTSTSAGRMMLNILMSFSQYEREIIAERIRDKIAASKKRGMHCGGTPVLGYASDPVTKKLHIIPDEAEVVRKIFEVYEQIGSLAETVVRINHLGYRTKIFVSAKGIQHGGREWDTGSVHKILINPLYAGYVKHYKARYEGEHEAIVDRKQWERVQEQMKSHNNGTPVRKSRSETTPLRGIVFCGYCRSVLTPTYTVKAGKKYTYFFCQQHSRNPEHQCPLRRIPSGELEQMVLTLLSGVLQTPTLIRETLAAVQAGQQAKVAELRIQEDELKAHMQRLKSGLIDGTTDLNEVKSTGEKLASLRKDIRAYNFEVTEEEIMRAMRDTHALWEELFPVAKFEILKILVAKIVIFQDNVSLDVNLDGLKRLIGELSISEYFRDPHEANSELETEITQTLNDNGTLSLAMPIRTKKVNGHCRIVHPMGGETPTQTAIIRAIRRAQLWEEKLCSGEAQSVAELSKKVGFKEGYVRQLLTLNSLAPDIVSAILAGNEPDGLSLARLRQGFPEDWAEQRRTLGFA